MSSFLIYKQQHLICCLKMHSKIVQKIFVLFYYIISYNFCWRRKWQSIPVFLPGKFLGQWSLVGYSPWGHKESDTTDTHAYFLQIYFKVGVNGRKQMLDIDGNNKGSFISLSAAAAAKSLQSYPTLCDPIEGSPPGTPVPGILQARTLEWLKCIKTRSLTQVFIFFSFAF